MPKNKDGKYLKMSKVPKDPLKEISGYNPLDHYQAIGFRGRLWYPTAMVAWFMVKDKSDSRKYNRTKLNLASILTRKRLCPLEAAIKGSFRKLDGNWFTTEEAFNAALVSRGKDPVKFFPTLDKRIIYCSDPVQSL